MFSVAAKRPTGGWDNEIIVDGEKNEGTITDSAAASSYHPTILNVAVSLTLSILLLLLR